MASSKFVAPPYTHDLQPQPAKAPIVHWQFLQPTSFPWCLRGPSPRTSVWWSQDSGGETMRVSWNGDDADAHVGSVLRVLGIHNPLRCNWKLNWHVWHWKRSTLAAWVVCVNCRCFPQKGNPFRAKPKSLTPGVKVSVYIITIYYTYLSIVTWWIHTPLCFILWSHITGGWLRQAT